MLMLGEQLEAKPMAQVVNGESKASRTPPIEQSAA